MSSRPTTPDDVTLAPSSSLVSRGVQGDLSIKISDRTIHFKGPRIRNIQAAIPVPTADYLLPPPPAYASRPPEATHCVSCPQTTWYFECTVLDQPRGAASLVCVGLAPCDLPGYVLGPGMEMSGKQHVGVGFHSTGRKYVNGDYVAHYGSAFGAGDTVGVGWDTLRNIVFFTLNGKALGTAAAECIPRVPEAGTLLPLFPTFGGTRGAVLSVNFGTESFMFEPANQETLGFFMDPLPKYSMASSDPTQLIVGGHQACAFESTADGLAHGDLEEMDFVDMRTLVDVPMYGGWSDPPAY